MDMLNTPSSHAGQQSGESASTQPTPSSSVASPTPPQRDSTRRTALRTRLQAEAIHSPRIPRAFLPPPVSPARSSPFHVQFTPQRTTPPAEPARSSAHAPQTPSQAGPAYAQMAEPRTQHASPPPPQGTPSRAIPASAQVPEPRSQQSSPSPSRYASQAAEEARARRRKMVQTMGFGGQDFMSLQARMLEEARRK